MKKWNVFGLALLALTIFSAESFASDKFLFEQTPASRGYRYDNSRRSRISTHNNDTSAALSASTSSCSTGSARTITTSFTGRVQNYKINGTTYNNWYDATFFGSTDLTASNPSSVVDLHNASNSCAPSDMSSIDGDTFDDSDFN